MTTEFRLEASGVCQKTFGLISGTHGRTLRCFYRFERVRASMQPVVSIILPTFGRLQYLRSTVASIYQQTLQDWELIVADDGSDVETRTYLQTLEADSRVKLVWLTHTGVPAAVRNAALGEARGEYVAFLDSDDLWAPDKLSRQVASLRSRPTCGWCYTAVSHIDGPGRPMAEPVFGPWIPCEGAVFERLVTGPIVIRTPSVLARRELVAAAGGFDDTIRSGEDYDLWLRLALLSDVALLDETLVQVRRHEANLSQDWEIAFAGRDHSLHKLQDTVDSRRRALLRAERTRNALILAGRHAALGNSARLLSVLWRALPYSWSSSSWWLGMVKTTLRPHVPRRLLEARRRRRSVATA
jgi:glycosyltransferase involved in cell wall biosynthesis